MIHTIPKKGNPPAFQAIAVPFFGFTLLNQTGMILDKDFLGYYSKRGTSSKVNKTETRIVKSTGVALATGFGGILIGLSFLVAIAVALIPLVLGYFKYIFLSRKQVWSTRLHSRDRHFCRWQ